MPLSVPTVYYISVCNVTYRNIQYVTSVTNGKYFFVNENDISVDGPNFRYDNEMTFRYVNEKIIAPV